MAVQLVSILFLGVVALAVALGVGYPLLTGRLRFGGEIVERASDPGRFWRGFAVSTGGMLVALAVGYAILRHVASAVVH